MRRALSTVSALAAVVLAVAGCGSGGSQEPAGPPAGAAPTTAAPEPTTAAPDTAGPAEIPQTLAFQAPTVDGGELDAATLAGRPVVFWFWAAWCPRCAAFAGDLRQVAAEYEGRAQVVGVAGLGSGTDGMRGFIADHELDGFPHLADDEGEVWVRFGVTVQEYLVILDAAGVIVHEGPLTAQELRDQLATLTA
jgi:peroxiredoxin/predicted small lipoprotein YifL